MVNYGRAWRATIKAFCDYAEKASRRTGFLGVEFLTHGLFTVRDEDTGFRCVLFYNVKIHVGPHYRRAGVNVKLTFSDLHTVTYNDATEVGFWYEGKQGDLARGVLEALDEDNNVTPVILCNNATNLLRDPLIAHLGRA